MSGKKKGYLFTFLVILSLMMSPLFGLREARAVNPGPFFSITILTSNTSTERSNIATLLANELPKIGIEVDQVAYAGWTEITSRSWGHPGPYPIPTYAEGGYDVLLLTWTHDFEFDPRGIYESTAITPNGNNFYQYSNVEMDAAVANHSSTLLIGDRHEAANAIQSIAYDDLPSIAIVYTEDAYTYNESLSGWDSLLWSKTYQPVVGWSMGEATDFHYGVPAQFQDFHPYCLLTPTDAQWINQLYCGLARRDTSINNHYNTWIAQNWASADGLTFNIEIKADACWADGTDLTTDDIIYNYQLAVTPALGGVDYNFNKMYWDNDSITKINDKEFTITFKSHYIYQESFLALNLIPEHIWGDIPPAEHKAMALNWSQNYPEKMFGAGPYKLEDYDNTSQIIHLDKNTHFDTWFGMESTFNDIYFDYYSNAPEALEALESGNIDMIDAGFNIPIEDLDLPGFSYEKISDGGVTELAINMEHPYIGTGALCPIAGAESAKHIRKAISYLFARENISEVIYDDLASPGATFWTPGSIDYNASFTPIEYNLDYARYHMSQAGNPCVYNSTPPYATPTTPEETAIFGLSIPIILGIFALIGSTISVISKRRR